MSNCLDAPKEYKLSQVLHAFFWNSLEVQVAFSINRGVRTVTVLIMRALLFGIFLGTPTLLKNPIQHVLYTINPMSNNVCHIH